MSLKIIEASLAIAMNQLDEHDELFQDEMDIEEAKETLLNLSMVIKKLNVVRTQIDDTTGIYSKTKYLRDNELWTDLEMQYLSSAIIREYSCEIEYLFYIKCSDCLSRSVENVKTQTQAIIEQWRVQYNQFYETNLISGSFCSKDSSEMEDEIDEDEDEDAD